MRLFTAGLVGLASAGVLAFAWNDGLHPVKAQVLAVPAVLPTTSSVPTVSPSATAPSRAVAPRVTKPRATTRATLRPTTRTTPRPTTRTTTPTVPQPQVAVGALVQTQFGDVQVAVHYTGTRITDIVALHLTDSSGTSVDISAAAAPILRHEALAAQSARIDMVSGASFTSAGYIQSLQAALDAAHI